MIWLVKITTTLVGNFDTVSWPMQVDIKVKGNPSPTKQCLALFWPGDVFWRKCVKCVKNSDLLFCSDIISAMLQTLS